MKSISKVQFTSEKTINVYVGKVCDFDDFDKLPAYAEEKLKNITNARVASEKKAGYGILAFAMNKSDVKNCFLSDTGKPMHKDFEFSISHAGELVAVAVADSPVGIDVEIKENEEKVNRIKEKILHKNDNEENILKLWTIKEAAFKFSGESKFFRPSEIDSTKHKSESTGFKMYGKDYIISVVGGGDFKVLYKTAPDGKILDTKKCG